MPVFIALLDRQPVIIAMTVLVSLLVIFKHRENIQRLRSGTESKFKA